ncbi:phosphatidate cytidylyltransferase [Ureibacillus sp. FSL K6-8385]|uniref:Phosphatidate cytidylyltransferase n=1 Tax=Ureibacillus terrenus TaxID=118246 RepID=A0A540V4H5_9BACL|nr:phosphatidate cytidylyltransferase [Ureibacillus terrenus]MED3660432.1 phosphatidate cytidylyltransferase [Ureibacillus terrenus]MED3762587.1 phosphatidate cytidylyltransferase [Ureibacillus terrenus]TQE91650.1 phosphatidate cytidylyltransferase [Ureibacillus terrenus]
MKQRIITAVIAAAFFIPFVVYGKLPFALLVYAMATVAMFELLRMKKMSIFSVPGFVGFMTVYILLMPDQWANKLHEATSYSKLEFLVIAALLLLIHSVIVKNQFTFDEIGFVLLSALYVGIGFYYLIETRNAGLEFIIFALLIVWSTDSGAYFIGRKFGKNKLWPEISPNKTVEGFFGGILTAIVITSIMHIIYPFDKPWFILILVTIVSSVFGQLGDLVESAIKRHYDVKDSGKILPGHGGILDRFDSLLFVLPLLNLLHFVS